MDLTYTDAENAFRAEARAWLRDNVPVGTLVPPGTKAAFDQSREWDRALYDAGWSVVTWPSQYGGRDASLIDWMIFEEEYHRVRAPYRVSQNGISLLAPTIFHFGTAEQKAEHLIAIARGDVIWAQAWSEPGSGSDLASLTSRARPDGDGFRLTGQKIWSSHAKHADRAFGLFRMGERSDRYRNLTYFLIDLRAEGVTVRAIPRLDGQSGFAEIFFDDVYVPATDVLGEVGQGWQVAMATTGSERGFALRSPGRFLSAVRRLVASAAAAGEQWDTVFAERVTAAYLDSEAYNLHILAIAAKLGAGRSTGAESSYDKLYWSELDVRIAELGFELRQALPVSEAGARDELADWLNAYITALPGTIWGGTSEIQHNIVAQRVLGLPRGA